MIKVADLSWAFQSIRSCSLYFIVLLALREAFRLIWFIKASIPGCSDEEERKISLEMQKKSLPGGDEGENSAHNP